MINKKRLKKEILLCLLVCAAAAVLSLIYFIIRGGGAFTVVDDFNMQEIPFNTAMHNAVSLGGEWNWGLDLGTANIHGFGFYGLGGVYAWIMMLFPSSMVPYLIGWGYVLKYTVAGLTSFLWLRKFVKDYRFAVVGALLYAFSGFQTANLEFYHFHDVVSFFPLLLLSLDHFEEKYRQSDQLLSREGLLFSAAVAVNCLCNYYFFVEEIVFLILYFIVRYFCGSELKRSLKVCGGCLLYGCLGVGLAAILFLPSVRYILQNSRTESHIVLSSFFPNPLTSLFLIKNYLLPAEPMNGVSAVVRQHWGSTSAYLPMLGMTGVIAYLQKKKDWLSRLMKVLIVISFIPVLSSGFLLFTESNQRWFFMMILMFAAAAAIVLENVKDYPIVRSILIEAGLMLGFYFLVSNVKWAAADAEVLVFDKGRFAIYTAISLAGLVTAACAVGLRKKYYLPKVLIGAAAFCVITTAVTLHFYRAGDGSTQDYLNTYRTAEKLEVIDDQYRYRWDRSIFGLVSKEQAGGLSSFSSTITPSIRRFDELFDYQAGNFSLAKNSIAGLPELLGGKYVLTEDPAAESEAVRRYDSGEKTYYVIEASASPIGYAVDSYLTIEEVRELPVEYRAIALLRSAAVDQADAGSMLTQTIGKDEIEDIQNTCDSFGAENLQSYAEQLAAENESKAVGDFQRDGYGFTCTSSYSEDKYVYFAVPNEEGWSASIDGVETEIIDSNGMMLILVPKGSHEIVFRYATPWFKAGKLTTMAALIIFIVLFGMSYKKRNESAE